jgi:hypothetical protein
MNDNDGAEQDALVQIEGPDEDGCVWACSNEDRLTPSGLKEPVAGLCR